MLLRCSFVLVVVLVFVADFCLVLVGFVVDYSAADFDRRMLWIRRQCALDVVSCFREKAVRTGAG